MVHQVGFIYKIIHGCRVNETRNSGRYYHKCTYVFM